MEERHSQRSLLFGLVPGDIASAAADANVQGGPGARSQLGIIAVGALPPVSGGTTEVANSTPPIAANSS